MTRILAVVLTTFIPIALMATNPAQSQEASTDSDTSPGTELAREDGIFRATGALELSSFLWTTRAIVVFADSPADPRFQQQIDLLKKEVAQLVARDVVVLTDTDPEASSPIRTKLRPRGFQMVLVDKDGGVKLRKPRPWTVREITRSIDKTPLRLREVEERRKIP